jgi:hypothetical protein
VLHHLPKLGTWERAHLTPATPRFNHRFRLYDHLQSSVLGDEPIDYLEFGVYKGESMRSWTDLHANPESRFYGFDSFEGLPEAWVYFGGTIGRAAFNAGGRVPDVPDERAEFVKGLFQESLPDFLADFEPRARVVLHCDADLYSSMLYVLTQCDSLLVPARSSSSTSSPPSWTSSRHCATTARATAGSATSSPAPRSSRTSRSSCADRGSAAACSGDGPAGWCPRLR